MKDDLLQNMARKYLNKIKKYAEKYGLKDFVDNLIKENKRGACKATVSDINILARICNDDRIKRSDVPKLLGKSYRYCTDHGIFKQIKILRPTGRLSKTDTILIKKDLNG